MNHLVHITISWEDENFPGIQQLSMHVIVDEGPEFSLTEQIVNEYEGLDQLGITIRYEDMPLPLPEPTHYLDHRVQ